MYESRLSRQISLYHSGSAPSEAIGAGGDKASPPEGKKKLASSWDAKEAGAAEGTEADFLSNLGTAQNYNINVTHGMCYSYHLRARILPQSFIHISFIMEQALIMEAGICMLPFLIQWQLCRMWKLPCHHMSACYDRPKQQVHRPPLHWECPGS